MRRTVGDVDAGFDLATIRGKAAVGANTVGAVDVDRECGAWVVVVPGQDLQHEGRCLEAGFVADGLAFGPRGTSE